MDMGAAVHTRAMLLSPYLNGTGCRMTSSMLALLLSGGSGRRLRVGSVWMQSGIRMCVLLSKGAGGN